MSSSERPEWLPSGWTIEVKGSDGEKRECYIDPETRCEFYSMQEVSHHLDTVNSSKASEKTGDKSSSEQNISKKSEVADVEHSVSKKKLKSIRKSNYKVISRTPADGLPPGWIKEVRFRVSRGSRRKDPYYLDPSSDYVFFSKLDALRYLDTGDIEKCATKPTQRDISENEMKPEDTTTGRQLFEGDTESPKKSIASPPSRSPKRLKGLDPNTKSSPSLNQEATQAQPEVQPEGDKNKESDHLEDTKEAKPEESNVEKSTNVKTLGGETPFEAFSASMPLHQESVANEAIKKDDATKTDV